MYTEKKIAQHVRKVSTTAMVHTKFQTSVASIQTVPNSNGYQKKTVLKVGLYQ